MDRMGIQEEIFKNFFKKLREDKEFPNSIIDELTKLWETGEIISHETIFEIITRGCADAGKD